MPDLGTSKSSSVHSLLWRCVVIFAKRTSLCFFHVGLNEKSQLFGLLFSTVGLFPSMTCVVSTRKLPICFNLITSMQVGPCIQFAEWWSSCNGMGGTLPHLCWYLQYCDIRLAVGRGIFVCSLYRHGHCRAGFCGAHSRRRKWTP